MALLQERNQNAKNKVTKKCIKTKKVRNFDPQSVRK